MVVKVGVGGAGGKAQGPCNYTGLLYFIFKPGPDGVENTVGGPKLGLCLDGAWGTDSRVIQNM